MKKKTTSKTKKPAKKSKKSTRPRAKPVKKSARRKPPAPARKRASVKIPAAPKRARANVQTPPKPAFTPPTNGVEIGRVEDYFAHINVIALTLLKELSLGARIQVLGHTSNFEQAVDSMQIDHQPVTQAPAGSAVGIKTVSRARKGDHVYLLLG